jgi:nucleoside-diphosphate-sugar epimerase
MGDASLLDLPAALIFGANGKTARQLTAILHKANPPYRVFGVIRNPDQIPDLEGIGVHPVVQDIADASDADFKAIIEHAQPDVVVWAAGGKDAESAKAVDQDGAIRAFDALSKADVKRKRYIVISALDVRDRENRPVPDWYTPADIKLSDRMYGIIGPIMRAKLAADRELRVGNAHRKLDYTIVRPGGLVESSGTGKVRAGKVGTMGMIPREDVAGVIYASITNTETYGLAFDILGAGDDGSSITKEVSRVAEAHEDTFEGYY